MPDRIWKVPKRSTSGLFSSLRWGKVDLLLQTEIIRKPETRFATLLMAGGEVVSRIEGRWPDLGESQFHEQRRINGYHERLLKAMKRLRDEKEASLEDLKKLFERLVKVAISLSASLTSEALAMVSGAHWVALVDKSGRGKEAAPQEGAGVDWYVAAGGLLDVARSLSGVFKAGRVECLSLRTGVGALLVLPHGNSTMLVEVDTGKEEMARGLVTRLVSGTVK